MAPTIPSAKLTLSCPLFAADFDPRNHTFLLVAGGGGEGRSGTLLNASKRRELSEVVDIELSRDEDSVTSLAAAHANDDSIVALAGINSSVAEQKKGNNQHLRSFRIDYPPRRADPTAKEGKQPKKKDGRSKNNKDTRGTTGGTTALSRVSLFRTKGGSNQSADTYQRITRLSPWGGEDSPRVAAITTGLAPSGEIVFFNAASTTPSAADVIGRIRLNGDEEAEDIDIATQDDDGSFPVAYTNGTDVFTCRVNPETRSNVAPGVKCVYKGTVPPKGPRPKFRALRFISPTSLLLLQNAPERRGCELILVDLRPTFKLSSSPSSSSAVIVRRRKLRSAIKIGLGLDVCNLGTNPKNEQQTVIAVSGSDQSIETFTIEFDPRRQHRVGAGYTNFRPYASLREVHPFSMTRICFSNFIPPSHPISPETPAQYIKLASVSMGNTIVVHTFPLAPCPPSSHTPRYVLVMPGESEIWTNFSSATAALFSIVFVIFAVQFFTEIRGLMPPYLGAQEWLPADLRQKVARPYIGPSRDSTPIVPVPTLDSSSAPSAAAASVAVNDEEQQKPERSQLSALLRNTIAPLIRCNPTTNDIYLVEHSSPDGDADTNTDTSTESARRWSDLSNADRSAWKNLLAEKGYWMPDTDKESILDSLLFGDLCDSPANEE